MTPDKVRDFIAEHDTFARHLDIELLEVGEGRARARMPLDARHVNALKIAHGGAVFALADLAFAAASNSRGAVAVAVNASITYHAAGTGPFLAAEARELHRSRRLGSYEVRVTDHAGALVATFNGMVYRKKERVGEAG
ncbi:MAG: PaaI family thioesterase [Thermodesulfobacteriota bacterium]